MNDYVLELVLWPLQAVFNLFLVIIFTVISLDDAGNWWNRFLVFMHWVLLLAQPVILTIWVERSGFLASENGTRCLEEIALWLLRSRPLVIPFLSVARVFVVAWVFHWVVRKRGHEIVVSGTSSACMVSIATDWKGNFGSLGPYFTWREFWMKARIMADRFDKGADDDDYCGVYFAVDKFGLQPEPPLVNGVTIEQDTALSLNDA